MAKEQQEEFVINQNLIRVISLNQDVPLAAATVRAIAVGHIVTHDGCITRMLYQNDGKDLTLVELDSGEKVTTSSAKNLPEFRERLEEAACCGYGVRYCLDTTNNRMFMLHLFPCRCKCDQRG